VRLIRISMALTLCPYSFWLSPSSCFTTASSSDSPANTPCDRGFSGKFNGRRALTAPTAVSPASTTQQKQH